MFKAFGTYCQINFQEACSSLQAHQPCRKAPKNFNKCLVWLKDSQHLLERKCINLKGMQLIQPVLFTHGINSRGTWFQVLYFSGWLILNIDTNGLSNPLCEICEILKVLWLRLMILCLEFFPP